jgi:hypothetical protein
MSAGSSRWTMNRLPLAGVGGVVCTVIEAIG